MDSLGLAPTPGKALDYETKGGVSHGTTYHRVNLAG